MSISNSDKRTVSPTHQGEMLREDFMAEYGLTVTSLNMSCVYVPVLNNPIHSNRF